MRKGFGFSLKVLVQRASIKKATLLLVDWRATNSPDYARK